MADENTLNRINDEYEMLRIKASDARQKRIDEVNSKIPRVGEIDREIFELGLKNTGNIFKNPEKKDEYNSEFKKKLTALENEKNSLLTKNGIDANYDKYVYTCPHCSDTGYTPDGKKCICFKQRLINEAYSVSNMSEIVAKQNFNTFSFDYYSKESKDGAVSPYENMVRIYNSCKRFCENFDNDIKSILFYGGIGLGKTFLSSAIAKEIMDIGKTVVYIRAARMFIINRDYGYGKISDKSILDNIYNADLLIIDDLGTEANNDSNFSFLLDVINERVLNNKKIIINTNYTMKNMEEEYGPRFMSRLYEYFNVYKFYGEDIRVQKLKNGTI